MADPHCERIGRVAGSGRSLEPEDGLHHPLHLRLLGASDRPEARLKTIFDAVTTLIEREAPDAVALEESFVGVDARTALSVGQARGAILVASALAGVECAEYSPSRVKQAVCGYGRAEKAQVQRMVQAILGLETPPAPSHAADALAVGICHALAPPLLKAVSA